jgi:hypothetical protein
LHEDKSTYLLAQEIGLFAQFAEAGKNGNKAVHLLEKSVTNMI